MSGERHDHYTVLGVTVTASPGEITHAFHRLVRRHHPDNDGDPDALRAVVRAYQVLRDPDRRAAYDRQLAPPRAATPVRALDVELAPDVEPVIRVGPVRYHGRPW